jgi:hypothetical protein
MISVPFDPSNDDLWSGGYYEAAMVLGGMNDLRADERLRAAISKLWSHEALRVAAIGDLARWRWDGPPLLESRPSEDLRRIYGAFDDPTLGSLPFTSVVVRETPDGDDWLYACVPLGGLAVSDGYPFGDKKHAAASRSWREPLEKSVAGLVLSVCVTVPIHIAAIGFEIAGHIESVVCTGPDEVRYVGHVGKYGDGYYYWPTTVWS